MKSKRLTGVFIMVVLALALRASGEAFPPCTSEEKDPTTCNLHTNFDKGYPICATERVDGPTQDFNYGPGKNFIVTSVYRVPYSADYYQWEVDNEAQVCLDTWSAHDHFSGTCQDFDISLFCSSGP
jgi:hypothetical protein